MWKFIPGLINSSLIACNLHSKVLLTEEQLPDEFIKFVVVVN